MRSRLGCLYCVLLLAGCTSAPSRHAAAPWPESGELSAAWGTLPPEGRRFSAVGSWGVADPIARLTTVDELARIDEFALDTRAFRALQITIPGLPGAKGRAESVVAARALFLHLLDRPAEAVALVEEFNRLRPGRPMRLRTELPSPPTSSGPADPAELAQAVEAAERFDFAEAEALLEKAKSNGAGFAGLAWAGALIYRNRGELGAAREVLEAAARSGARRPEPYALLGEIALAQRDHELAEFFFAVARRYGPDHFPALRGLVLAKQKVLGSAAAISHMEQLAEKHSGTDGYRTALGFAYQLGGRPLEAKNAYQNEIRAFRGSRHGFLYLGDLSKAEGDSLVDHAARRHAYRYALASFEMHGKLWPKDPSALQRTAELYFDVRDLDAATKNYEKLIALAPRYPLARLRLAQIARNAGRKEEALALLNEEIELNPSPDSAWVERGNIAMAEKSFSEASRCFAEAYRLNPRNQDALFGDGVVKHLRGDYEGALALFRHTLNEDPMKLEVHWQMGLIYQKTGRAAEATDTFRFYRYQAREPASVEKAEGKLRELEPLLPAR